MGQSKNERMLELVELLNKASRSYYQDAQEIMSNYEYDRLYDELQDLEKELGITLSNSPTVNVGYEVVSELPKERHESPMLSLDKTKEVEELKNFVGSQKVLMSWKMDGLTIVLTYRDGKLYKAVTRGNGEVGEVVTNNAKVFKNVPVQIAYRGELILRGEAVIGYHDFEKINEEIEDVDAKYKNPRNLCSGSVRQLNNQITAKRNVMFYAFTLVQADGVDFQNSRACQMEWLKAQGFTTVEYHMVTRDTVEDEVAKFSSEISKNDFPSDGLVLSYDDIAYGRLLGRTAKFPRDSYAFKWQDEIRETILREIEWSPSRTGLINPVAIFDPVELEGTTVSRASVHNISIMEELELGIGDKIEVYKANMIIPQIAENLTASNSIHVPDSCPVCQHKAEIRNDNGVETLFCTNPECLAKQIKSFTLFVSRDAMNIDGLSEATIEKLIAKGLIKELADVFHVERFQEEITEMEGFGEKSFENLKASVEKAKDTTPERLLYALGIPGIGVANARLIARACHRKWEKIVTLTQEELVDIDGIGDIMASAFVAYFGNPSKKKIVDDIIKVVRLDETEEETADFLDGITFVITGSLNHYENRDALKAEIEKAGGKVSGSVSTKTGYLINNDLQSGTGKNKKAKELNIPIIDEETIKRWLETGEIENA